MTLDLEAIEERRAAALKECDKHEDSNYDPQRGELYGIVDDDVETLIARDPRADPREGPLVTITRSCRGCKYESCERYVAQGDSGYKVRCSHPERKGHYIGDTTWATPDWCPFVEVSNA